MNRRYGLLIAIALVLIALIIAIAWWLWPRPGSPAISQPNDKVPERVPRAVEPSETGTPLSDFNFQAASQASLEQTIRLFTERFGSYSHESRYGNLQDVLPYLSLAYRQRAEVQIADAKIGADYFQVSTRVLSVKTEVLDEEAGVGALQVSTQREFADGSPQNRRVEYQTLLVDVVKESGAWKINSATWQ